MDKEKGRKKGLSIFYSPLFFGNHIKRGRTFQDRLLLLEYRQTIGRHEVRVLVFLCQQSAKERDFALAAGFF